MNLIRQQVKSRAFGIGTVTAQDDGSITVEFLYKTSRFIFPMVFTENYITAVDPSIQAAILKEINEQKNTTVLETQLETGSRAEKMKAVYKEAWAYLKKIAPPELQGEELQKYFTVHMYDNFKNIAKVMFSNLQQRSMATTVIGFDRDKRKEAFQRLLLDYDRKAILKTYTPDTLFDVFRETFPVNNADSKNNLWRIYAKSIISFCKFIDRFKTVEDFDQYIRGFEGREKALTDILKKEIVGCGFALSCNFLKDIGYVDYPKPDVHIMEIFSAFGFCKEKDDLDAFYAVREMAKTVGDSAFVVDRLFWLIGSGDFYDHKIKIGSQKKKFINSMRAKGF